MDPLGSVAEFKITDKTPKLSNVSKVSCSIYTLFSHISIQIQETLERGVSAKAVVACFFIQEGANLKLRNILGQTPLEGCTDPVLATVLLTFAERNAGLVQHTS